MRTTRIQHLTPPGLSLSLSAAAALAIVTARQDGERGGMRACISPCVTVFLPCFTIVLILLPLIFVNQVFGGSLYGANSGVYIQLYSPQGQHKK
jgi:hypothetical protein